LIIDCRLLLPLIRRCHAFTPFFFRLIDAIITLAYAGAAIIIISSRPLPLFHYAISLLIEEYYAVEAIDTIIFRLIRHY
jgi:hypothetical protein